MLSDIQIKTIKRRIEDSAITMQSLKDDVLDHLCCVVETKIKEGKAFEIALDEALHELTPKGLDEIQRQTIQLLYSPQTIFMKKVMYLIGLFSAASLSIGWLFTVLRWSGGVELFNYGFMIFLMLFIPLFAIDRYRIAMRQQFADKMKVVVGSISAFTIGLSLVFKLFHLQGADLVLIVGVLLFTFGFLPFLFFAMYKKAVAGS
jgi:hypothetical protein